MAYRLTNADALLQEGWETTLREESQEQDIYTSLTGVSGVSTDNNKASLPNGIIQRVNMPVGANSWTIGLLLDLEGAGVQGAGKNLIGNVEDQATRDFTIFANDVKHGVNTEQYGLHQKNVAPYNIMEKATGQLTKWFKARKGKHIRQAILERISDNLQEDPHNIATGWNRNIFVKNVSLGAQPVYDSTLSDYEIAIRGALTTAGNGTDAEADVGFFTKLAHQASTVWKLEPINDQGHYICTVPSTQVTRLLDIQNGEGLTQPKLDSGIKEVVGEAWGQVLGVVGKMILVEDQRAPILDHDTNANTLTAAYRDVGNVDARASHINGVNNDIYNVGAVHGKASLTLAMTEDMHFEDDITDFNRLRSVGAMTTYGYQVTEFDDTTPTDDTRIGQNCGIWLAYSGSILA